MDIVNQKKVLPKEEKLTQVEELVKLQISRVEKILASSLTRTAALIERQLKNATEEDEERRKNLEKKNIISNTIETFEKGKSIKIKHDDDTNKDHSEQENKPEVTLNPVNTQKSSKTFKSVGTNTDGRIDHFQVLEDKPALGQQLVISDSTADRKRQLFAERKVYKHVTGPICTIRISDNHPTERTSSYIDESSEKMRIVVKTSNRGLSGRDVMIVSDALQKNNMEFRNRDSVHSDKESTVASNEQQVNGEEKLTLELDVSEFQTNSQIKEYVPQIASSFHVRESNIDKTSLKMQINADVIESDFSESCSTTSKRTTSKDVSGGKILIENMREKQHKRKARKTNCCSETESETSFSSKYNDFPLKFTKGAPDTNDIDLSGMINRHTRKKMFDHDERSVSEEDTELLRRSAPELPNTRKARCKRYFEKKCVSYPIASSHSHSSRGHYNGQSNRGVDCESINPQHLLSENNKKSIFKQQPKSPNKTASICSDNTSCGVSGNLSEASVEFKKLENETNEITSNIVCDRLVGDSKARTYSLLDSTDDMPANADGTYSNGNKQYHDPHGDVTLLQGVGTRKANCVSNNVEKESNLQFKENESDHTDANGNEKLESITQSRELNSDTESIQKDTTFYNREQLLSATDISGSNNSSNFETCLENTPNTVQTGRKSESTPEISDKFGEKTLQSAQTQLDDSSSAARSFEDKYHTVLGTLEKHLKVSKASKDSHDTHSDELSPNMKFSKGERSRSKSVSLEHLVSSGETLQNGPLSDPIMSKPKGRHRARLSSESHKQVAVREDSICETRSVTEETSKCVDVISVSKSESSLKVDDSTSGRLDSSIHNHSIEKEDERASSLNDTNLTVDITPKLENNHNTKPLDLTIDDSSVSAPEESSASVQKNNVVKGSCNNIDDNIVGEYSNGLDLTDTEGLDSSFYERSASRRIEIKTANESSSIDSDVSFVAESSVSSLEVFLPANDKENTQHGNISDSSVNVPLSLEYFTDIVTPVTSLRNVIDEWSEPIRKPFKLKQKSKRLNRKKVITDVYVNISGNNRKQPQSVRRTSTPCIVPRGFSVTSSIDESDRVEGESELSTSVIQYSSIHELSNTGNDNTSKISVEKSYSMNDNELTSPKSNQDLTSLPYGTDDHDDSILSNTSSLVAYQRQPNATTVTNDPVSKNTNSFLCDELEDEATTTEDVASSILPEDVDDTTDVDERLQMDETDFSDITDVLGTSTETFTKIENLNYKPNIN
ncbi:hypothetical protein LOTGIDRAFT_166584 [Lottia gigantea]|uniref:Uncharacterized protein n=1 Tax=Lottia gigantea TaxID=225164 RepID=V4A2C9_LOTGI|nr:hypothetical protein LOTGIDRAFT_166584 [Lottia gigantea]ESO87436.1 hypothetical protein LOTGIDRAFT_166584 [Lottia gigantea]